MYPVKIEGPRVILRDFEPDDLDPSMAIVGDPEVTVFLSFDSRTREQQAERLAGDLERARAEPRPDYYLAIVARDTGTLIGFVRIGLNPGEPTVGEVGFALRKDRWRQGYTTEATGLMLDFGFDTLGLRLIRAACGPDNAGSQATLRTLGFSYQTRISHHVFTNGAWRDSLQYALPEHAWRARSSNP